MKKGKVFLAGVLAAVFATSTGALVACGDDDSSKKEVKNVFEITFDANGGNYNGKNQVKLDTDKNGKIVTAPADPTYEDHTFKGYTLTKDSDSVIKLGSSGYTFTKNTTVYASWTAIEEGEEYTIAFNVGEHGTIAGENTATTVGGKLAALPEVTPADGWTFDGWYTAETDGTKITTNHVFEANATIYAQYTEEGGGPGPVVGAYTITFNVGEHGTIAGENTATTVGGKLAALPEVTPADGWTFDGWYTAASDGTEITTDYVFEADATIYAQYTEDQPVHISVISLDNETLSLSIGQTTGTLTASLTDGSTDVTWTSSAIAVATVAGGVVTAKKPGTATITATAENGDTATCEVTVADGYYLIGGQDSSWSKVASFGLAGKIYFMPTETEGVYKTVSTKLSKKAAFQVALVGETGTNWYTKAINSESNSSDPDNVLGTSSTNFEVSHSGMYTITLDMTGAKPVVSAVCDTDLSDEDKEEIYYIVGSMNSWTTVSTVEAAGIYAFTPNGDGTHTLTVNLTKNAEFKVVIVGMAWNGEIGEGGVENGKIVSKGTATASGAAQLEWTSSSNIGVGVTGWYTFTLDPSVSGRGRLTYTFSLTDPNEEADV